MDAERIRTVEALILRNLALVGGTLALNGLELHEYGIFRYSEREVGVAITNLVRMGKVSLRANYRTGIQLKAGSA